MEKLNLYCDVDSTINNHWVRAQKHYGTNLFSERYVIMQDSPLPGAREVLWEYSDRFNIHYLTARPYNQAYSITHDWLVDNDFPIDSITVVNSSMDKVAFLLKNSVDIFIDDLSADQKNHGSYKILHEDVIKKLEELSIPYLRFKGDWEEVKGRLELCLDQIQKQK